MRTVKRWLAIVRRKRGKRNGVIPGYAFDDLGWFKLERELKYKRRKAQPVEDG